MSRLSELLNPTPNHVEPHSSPDRQDAHRRQQSLTSPLEALAIAASNSPTQASSMMAMADNDSGERSPQLLARRTEDSPNSQAPPELNAADKTNTSPRLDHALDQEQQSANSRSESVGLSSIAPAEGATTPTYIIERETERMPSADTVVKTEAKDGVAPNDAGQYQAEAGGLGMMALKQEDGSHNGSITGSAPIDPQDPIVLPTTESKKRAPTRTERKKGTASVIKKPATKKRKMEIESKDGTPFSQRSGTPSKTPGLKSRKRTSVTPAQSSPPPIAAEEDVEDDEEVDDDSELFCICRKPDDHTWMIACDGGCEDWFHGRCVDMDQQKGKLIDKYICPNCSANSGSVTTWKPMCRLESCREPARASGPNPSKYCSDAHGELYMRQRVLGKGLKEPSNPPARKKRRENNHDSSEALDEADTQNDKAHLRGGILRPSELKALTSGVDGVDEFRSLGNAISGPKAVSNAGVRSNASAIGEDSTLYAPEERLQLEKVASKKAEIDHKLEVLRDKNKFLNMVRARAKGVLEELKSKDKGVKDICGFDSRISWSDEEFDIWRTSSEGKEALESGVLTAPVEDTNVRADADGDSRMANGEGSHQEQVGKGACLKKRCERHKKWFQLHNQEVAFERDECRQQTNKLDKEERGIQQRAMLRTLETGDVAKEGVEA